MSRLPFVSSLMVALIGRVENASSITHPEQHDRTMAASEVTHRTVRKLAGDVVQVADDRQLPWPRRKPQLAHVQKPLVSTTSSEKELQPELEAEWVQRNLPGDAITA